MKLVLPMILELVLPVLEIPATAWAAASVSGFLYCKLSEIGNFGNFPSSGNPCLETTRWKMVYIFMSIVAAHSLKNLDQQSIVP